MANDVIRTALAWIGAAVFGACGAFGLWTSVKFGLAFFFFIQETKQSGSGGLGAVSVGFAEGIGWELVALPPSIVLNRVLARRARREGRLFASLHRAQSVFLLAVGALILLLLAMPFGLLGFGTFFTVTVLIVLALALQCLALAGVLGLLAISDIDVRSQQAQE